MCVFVVRHNPKPKTQKQKINTTSFALSTFVTSLPLQRANNKTNTRQRQINRKTEKYNHYTMLSLLAILVKIMLLYYGFR